MNYQSVILRSKGGADALEITTMEHKPLKKTEVRIKVQACGVGRTDLMMFDRKTAFSPKLPFVPGYEIIGVVQETGSAVKTINIGDRVGALTITGGYSEFITLQENNLVLVPVALDAAEAVSVILNYTTGYEMLVQVARVKKGDTVLITGASGGVGSALLDLGKMMGLKLYGTASTSKKKALENFGAELFDYQSPDFTEALLKQLPAGIDFVFDGVGESFMPTCFSVLKKGGTLIEYAFPRSAGRLFKRIGLFIGAGFKGKKSAGYGIALNYQGNKKQVLKDIAYLLGLLEKKEIKPLIYARLPLLEAAKANKMLERGEVTGKIVLLSPDLL